MKNMYELQLAINMVERLFKEAYELDCWGNIENQKKRDKLIWRAENIRQHVLNEFAIGGFKQDEWSVLLEHAATLRMEWRHYYPVATTEYQFGYCEEENAFGEFAYNEEGEFVAWANGIKLHPYCYQMEN